MILIALGSNLPHPEFGAPEEILVAARGVLASEGLPIERHSRLYRSPPWPPSSQPWYVNAVAEVSPESGFDAAGVLVRLHAVEQAFGRQRGAANAARILDLDLLDYQGRVSGPEAVPVLPHPRLMQRAFVLLPLRDVAPDWRHPVTGQSVTELISALPRDQTAYPIA